MNRGSKYKKNIRKHLNIVIYVIIEIPENFYVINKQKKLDVISANVNSLRVNACDNKERIPAVPIKEQGRYASSCQKVISLELN